MRQLLAALALVLCSITAPLAQVSVNIGINLGAYPQLVRVPGYPVYYAPQVNSNYFFYDGMYWVYAYDNWYASTWYNGPWELVAPDFVPLYVLRVPVRYYRRAPVYFRGWRSDAPPRWGDHWGNTWYNNHRGWDTWNRSAVPAPAPLPVYQRQYSGNRYPRADQQVTLQTRNYRYAPRDAEVQRQYQARQSMSAPAAPTAGASRAPSPPPAHQQAARPPSPPPAQQQAARPPNPQARPPNSQQPRPPQTDARVQSAQPPQSGNPGAERPCSACVKAADRAVARRRRALERRSASACAKPATAVRAARGEDRRGTAGASAAADGEDRRSTAGTSAASRAEQRSNEHGNGSEQRAAQRQRSRRAAGPGQESRMTDRR